jgi:hypothetical protein
MDMIHFDNASAKERRGWEFGDNIRINFQKEEVRNSLPCKIPTLRINHKWTNILSRNQRITIL